MSSNHDPLQHGNRSGVFMLSKVLPAMSGLPLLKSASVLAALATLGACGIVAQHPSPDIAPPASSAPAVPATPPPRPVEVPAPDVQVRNKAGEQTLRMLAYAERVRQMQPVELNSEIARLSDIRMPVEQLQLSFALSQLRQLPELIRAQELLARVLGNSEAEALHPLARLLASRYMEQRRLEEQVDKQTQQIRDTQRRLEQANERLEALKAIERSLVNRQPPPAPAPAAAAAPVAPAAAPAKPKSAP